MAEKSLEKIEDLVNCSICLDTYNEPKMLQCCHTYCKKCLVKLVIRDQYGQLSLTCPMCRQTMPVPTNGVAGLQPACHINTLLDIVQEHKNTKLEEDVLLCSKHEKSQLELFCEKCEKLICWKCTIKEHNGHQYDLVEQVFIKHKNEINTSLNPVREQLRTVNDALHYVDQSYGKVFDEHNALQRQICKEFQQLYNVIQARESDLLNQLTKITQEKFMDLASKRSQIENVHAQLSSCLEFLEDTFRSTEQVKVLEKKATLLKEVKQLVSTFQPDILEHNVEADMVFSVSTEILPECQTYGQIFTLGSPDPSKCYAVGKGTKDANVEEISTVVLYATDFKNQPHLRFIQTIESKFVSTLTGARVHTNTERVGTNCYRISYQPTIKGNHQLHIKVEGQHIQGSPFSVTAKWEPEKLGAPILEIDGVQAPCGAAIKQGGEVVITEHDRHCVSVFSPNGQRLQSFGTYGSGQGEFKNPRGVTVDGEGNILVVDNNNHRIQKFTAGGQFLTSVGNIVSQPKRFDYFQSITYNPGNSMVYVTNGCCVEVLNSELRCIRSFGKYGSSRGQFDYPWGIACDSTGKVYVADSANHRIQIFTAEGKFLKMFGGRGQEQGKLYWPYSIAIDQNDTMYISEFYNHRISVFNSNGQFVTAFGKFGEEPGEFRYPYALVLDKTGVIYMCDYGNNRIQAF